MANIVFDMDNTLSYALARLHKHPLHISPEIRKDKPVSELWKDYYEGCSHDRRVDGVLKLAHILQADKGNRIFIVTARDEQAREETEVWLKKHHVYYTEIYMRPINVTKKAALVKRDCVLELERKYGKVDLILEDDIRNIKIFQEMGISVIKPDTLGILKSDSE